MGQPSRAGEADLLTIDACVPLCQSSGVTVRIQCWCVDCSDPRRLAQFWLAVLPGWHRTIDTADEVVLRPPTGSSGLGPDLLFLRVPETKSAKNRIHLDLRPDDQAAEVARIEALGARRVDVGQRGDESWVVLADPEGNEFCVLRALSGDDAAYEGPGSG